MRGVQQDASKHTAVNRMDACMCDILVFQFCAWKNLHGYVGRRDGRLSLRYGWGN